MTVAEISLTKDEVQNMAPWRQRCLQKRATRLLNKAGATVVCKDGPGTLWRKICKEDMSEAVLYALRYLEGNPVGKTAWFLDWNCDTLKLSLLKKVSQKVQYLGLVTENLKKAERIEEELCGEYGVHLEIQTTGFSVPGRAALIADFDSGRVRIGRDLLIDGREFTLDLHGYQVDIETLLQACPALSQNLSHKAWLFGKKRLTR